MTQSPSHAPTYDETMRRGELARLYQQRADCLARIQAMEATARDRSGRVIGIVAVVLVVLIAVAAFFVMMQPGVTGASLALVGALMGGVVVALGIGALWLIESGRSAKARVAYDLPQWQAALADLDRQITALDPTRAPSVRR
jgi:hypothetical protein